MSKTLVRLLMLKSRQHCLADKHLALTLHPVLHRQLSTLLLFVIATIATSVSAVPVAGGLRSTVQAQHQQQGQEDDDVAPAASLLKNEYGSHCMSAADVMALVDGIEKGEHIP